MDFIAIVLDVGSHMFDSIENESSIILGINSVKGLVQKKLFSENKDEISIILCGSHETQNSLNNSDPIHYKHITIMKSLSKTDWHFLECLNETDSRYGSDKGDLLEAIIVAADHLVTRLRGQTVTGSKRVILISNLEGKIDFSLLDTIVASLDKEGIEINIISDREFCDDDSKDEPSTSDGRRTIPSNEKLSEIKLMNEKELSKMVVRLIGATYSFEDVLLSLDFFETKSTQPRGWKANLEISNICHISVVGYSKVKQAQPQTLKLRYGGDPSADVERRTTYHLNDSNNTTVNLEDTIKGFKYGNSLIPFSEDDIKSMELTKVKGLKLIGFCEEAEVPRHLYVGDSSMIFVADNPASEGAFTSLVHAMYECNMVALVRLVYSRVSAPRLASMSPVIKPDSVSLVYCELAFGEDIRSYVFPSLPVSLANVNSVNNTDKKKVISETQLMAVDSFIDHLMLIKTDPGSGKETEIYKPSKTVSPYIQMFYQSASHKYLNPSEVLPELNARVMSTLQIPEENQEGLEQLVEEIKTLFPLKNRDINAKKKKIAREELPQENGPFKKMRTESGDQPLSFGDIIKSRVTVVGLVSPIEDFLDLLCRGEVTVAIDGMQTIIWQLINDSYLDTLYPKAILCLIELRNRVKQYSLPDRNIIAGFNEFLQNMKNSLLLSPAKREFWNLLKKEGLTLIGESDSEFGCSDEDSQRFFDTKEVSVQSTDQKLEEMDTLFDDM